MSILAAQNLENVALPKYEIFEKKPEPKTVGRDGMKEISLSEELKKVIDDILEVARYLWERGWAERNAGNISVDITEFVLSGNNSFARFPKRDMKIAQPELAGRCFCVTVAGSRFRELARQPKKGLLIVSVADKLDGYHLLWGGEGLGSRPTSEFVSHLKMHNLLRRSNLPQRAIVHTHVSHLIALTHIEQYCREEELNRLLWAMHPEVKRVLPEGVGFVSYCRPGSEDLADATVSALKHHRVILWEKHGCIAIGNDVFEAFDLIDTVNKSAEIFFICKSAGYEPQGLTDEQVAELSKR